MYNRHFDYIVILGYPREYPDLHLRTAKHFYYIKTAREYARQYNLAGIYKCRYAPDSGDLIDIQEVNWY